MHREWFSEVNEVGDITDSRSGQTGPTRSAIPDLVIGITKVKPGAAFSAELKSDANFETSSRRRI